MKVIYDISVLSIGYNNPRNRTGIYRVIENVAEQLAFHSDTKMIFSTSLDEGAILEALDYLVNNPNLTNSSFSLAPFFLQRYRNKIKRRNLIDQIYSNNGEHKLKKVWQKILVRSLLAEEWGYNLFNNEYINKNDLKSSQIYHSPFFPIPEQVKRLPNKKKFLTSYDLIPIIYPQFSEDGVKELIKNVLDCVNKDTWVLCISQATRDDLLAYKGDQVDPNKVIVTELAASDKFYQSLDWDFNNAVRNLYGIPEGPYILSVCTLEPRKNIDQVIRGFVKIINEENIPDLNLVLVGIKGWMFDKIFDEIEASKSIKQRIIITGFVADEHLGPLYSDALLFVYPSFYEGFGLPPLEAMQCGTPVITSNTSSLPEVIGDAGIMVSPSDLDSLCQAMLSIYKSSSLREKMVEKSLIRAKKFTWERCALETVNAYKASLK